MSAPIPLRDHDDLLSTITVAGAPGGDHGRAILVWLRPDDDHDEVTRALAATLAELRRVRAWAEPTVDGWTRGTLRVALDRLRAQNGRVQAAAIRYALRHQGHVSRRRVQRLGGYPADRTLRGFTRPASRIVATMKLNDELPAHAVELLSSCYRPGSVQADGFTSPARLVTLLGRPSVEAEETVVRAAV